MDGVTLTLIAFAYLIVAYYHREEKKKGNSGIPFVGQVFIDPFWVMIEAIPSGVQITGWLDKKFKDHEKDLRNELKHETAQQSQDQAGNAVASTATGVAESPSRFSRKIR